jgi:hypothetical protein
LVYIKLAHPVDILACESIAKAPQNALRCCSISIQPVEDTVVDAGERSGSSTRSKPRECTRLTDLAELIDALVKSMHFASNPAIMMYACKWRRVK